MRRLRGASLIEAIIAALIFLTVFMAAMEVIPRLSVRRDETALLVEADFRANRAADKYASGCWPGGTYYEEYEWGSIEVRIAPYRDLADLQQLEISVQIEGSRRTLYRRRLIRVYP